MSRTSARPGVSVHAALLAAYKAAGSSVPPLSGLLAQAMREALERAGVAVPAAAALEQGGGGAGGRTARATAARWRRGG